MTPKFVFEMKSLMNNTLVHSFYSIHVYDTANYFSFSEFRDHFTLSTRKEAIEFAAQLVNACHIVMGLSKFESHFTKKLMSALLDDSQCLDILGKWDKVYFLDEPKKKVSLKNRAVIIMDSKVHWIHLLASTN